MQKAGIMKKALVYVTAAAMLVSFGAGDCEVLAQKNARLATKKVTVYTGKTKSIKIKNKKSTKKYAFSSNRKKIASVSSKGVIKGKKAGKAVITVKEKNKKGKAKTRTLGKVNVTVKKTKTVTKKTSLTTATATAITEASASATALATASATALASATTEPTATPIPTATPDPITICTPTPAATLEPKTEENHLYVAPYGDDTAEGTAEKPLKTLEKAKEVVRSMAKKQGDIVVEFGDGFYPIQETVKFSSKDSGTKDCTITYKAAKGAKPVFSGGQRLTGQWQVAGDVNWLKNGLVAYKIPLERNEKLRAIYVNGERASMTRKSQKPAKKFGTYKITKGSADWAWSTTGSTGTNKACKGAEFKTSLGLLPDTRNPQNIELESGSTWAKQVVCVDKLYESESGNIAAEIQMPYGAFAQNLGWGTAWATDRTNDVSNVFEFLEKEGQFYFDQAAQMLYYIPRKGEDLSKAEVIIPETDTLVDFSGDKPKEDYVEHINFENIAFAYTDWNLFEVDGSHGYASVQGSIVLANYGLWNQHDDMYRSYDVPPAAIHITSAKNVKILDGEIRHTGYLGIHLENDVVDCDVTGNYIYATGGAGVVVGHPTHIYENDTEIHKVKASNAAGPEKEKFKNGTEAVPKNINITNNYLLENCYFFPGNSPITTFYTYNLNVLHNFVYKCSYSGMSIGWGWYNFDGKSDKDADIDQYAQKGNSQLPGIPTTTSKNNHINNNRVEEICSLLQDAGGIYTLGQQGNDDWTEFSEMNDNYINCKRANQVANGSKMVNGFHPDEGSAYIKFDGNVVTNVIQNVYELNNWGRKHDMIVTNGFSNTDRSVTTAPNCTLDQYVNKDYIWTLRGYETVLYSGLEDKYVHMVDEDVIAPTEYELASHVRLTVGQKLPRRGLLKAEDQVYLAKKGAALVESDTCTKAAGNEKSMEIPKEVGEYKLYIKYADGRVSPESKYTLYVGEAIEFANVSEGENRNVSKVRPLVLQLKDDQYTFTLNDKAITNGEAIGTAGSWTLVATAKDGKKTTISFTTTVTIANQLLEDNVEVASGGEVKLSKNLGDSSKTIWLAPSGVSAFDASDPAMSRASGNSASMKAPITPGQYTLTVVGPAGDILSRSDASVTVK